MSHLTAPRHHLNDYEHAIDRLVNVIAFIAPLSSLPQIIEIWFIDNNAHGVSLVTWSLFVVMSTVWLFYGLVHKQRPIIVSNVLWIIAQGLVVIGALRFDLDWL